MSPFIHILSIQIDTKSLEMSPSIHILSIQIDTKNWKWVTILSRVLKKHLRIVKMQMLKVKQWAKVIKILFNGPFSG